MKIFTTYHLCVLAFVLLAILPTSASMTFPIPGQVSPKKSKVIAPPSLRLTVHGNPVKRVLRFEVLSDGAVKNSIYLTNLLGRNVLDIKTPKKESKNKEFYEVELDLDIPSGIYTLIVESGTERVAKRLQIL